MAHLGGKKWHWTELKRCWFHGPVIISAVANVVFWTFFGAKTCCVACHSYCFCYGGTSMAPKKCLKNHIPFDFWVDSTLANQEAGKTTRKPFKELPWNQEKEFPIKLQPFNSFQTPILQNAKIKNYHLKILSKPNNPFIASVLVIWLLLSKQRRTQFKPIKCRLFC